MSCTDEGSKVSGDESLDVWCNESGSKVRPLVLHQTRFDLEKILSSKEIRSVRRKKFFAVGVQRSLADRYTDGITHYVLFSKTSRLFLCHFSSRFYS